MTLWTRLAKFACFETDRLYLRPFSFEDGESFYEIVSNPENLPFIFPALEDRNIAFRQWLKNLCVHHWETGP